MTIGATGYPVGGPLEFARAIEQRYLDLGGEVSYRSPVTGILVENNVAVGVRLEDGTEHRADMVVCAADGHRAIFDWLGGKYVDDEIRGCYENLAIYHPMHFVTLCVDRPFEEVPPLATGEVFPLPEPTTIGRRQYEWLATHIYNYDTNVAPEGKSLIKVMLDADYAYWKELRDTDRARYRAEKEQIGEQLVDALDQRFPGLAEQVEVIDVSTPATFERYTGNWRGAWMGWVATPETMNMRVSKTLPGLEGFYMAGTWVLNGALAFAAMSGRHVTQLLCAKDKKRFTTSVP
jgi:phytoene dehydrogenase-like protein